MTPAFGPRFVPSTAARRFVLDDERTEVMPERLLLDRADTVRISQPKPDQMTAFFAAMPNTMKLVLAGILIGSVFAIVYAYSPLIG